MVKKFLKDNKEYFILSAIVFALMLTVYIIGGVFPFGNNSFGCYDFYYQVLDTTASIFHAGGRGNLFFTFDLANGWSSFASLFYACFSPFTIILLLGGISNIRFLFPLYIFLKFLAISLTALFFIRRYFKNLKPTTQILFALLYTFGCYGFMSVTWCVWLDLMIYIPLGFVAFDYIQKTGKIRWFTLVLTLMILTSFSIAIFTILYSIVIFSLYLWMIVPKENRKVVCAKAILSVSISLCCTLFVVIPSLVEMMHSTRTGGLLSSISNAEPTKYFWDCLGLFLTSIVPISLSVMFLFKSKLKTKTDKFYFYLFMICIIPALLNNINVAINFSAYAGYPLRLGALFNFVFTFMGLKFLNSYASPQGSEKDSKIFFLPLILLCVLTLTVGLIICLFINHYTANLAFNFHLVINIFVPVILFAVTILMIYLLKRFKKISLKTSKIFYAVIVGILAFTQTVTFLSGCTIEIGTEISYSSFASIINEDDPYANVKSRLNMNQITSGYSSISGFCSMIDKNTIETYSTLGYANNFHNISTMNGNLFSDMLAGIKYEISDTEMSLPWLTKVTENGKACLYENNLYIGHAFFTDNLPQLDDKDDFLTCLNKIYKSLSNDAENLFEKIDVTFNYSNPSKKTDDGFKFEDDTKMTCTFNAPNFSSVVYLNSTYFGNDVLFGSQTVQTSGSTMLGFNSVANSEISYSFDINANTTFSELYLYSLNYDKLVSLFEKMSLNLPKVSYTSDSITVHYESPTGKYLVVNHPKIYGYEYKLNDKKLEAESFVGFATFNVQDTTSGNATIQFTYPVVKISLICLAIGLVLGLMFVLIAYFFNKVPKKLLNIILYSFTVVAVLMATYYFAIPLVLMMIPI